MLLGASSREGKSILDVTSLKTLSDLLFENYEFIFHFRIDISLLVGGPKAPKSIADDVAEPRLLLFSENIMPQLGQDISSLFELLVHLL